MSLKKVEAVRLPRLNRSVDVRADGGALPEAPSADEVNKALAKMAKSFEDFKAKNDERLAAVVAGKPDDVVLRNQIEALNTEVTANKKALDAILARVEASRVPIDGGAAGNADRRAYSAAFRTWAARGIEAADMGQLAIRAGLSTDSKPDGGFTVPATVIAEVARLQGLVCTLRSLASVKSGMSYKKLINLGGSGSGWVGEKQGRTETGTPQLQEIEIVSGEIYAMPAATQQMLDDSGWDLESWLAEELSITFTEKEGPAFVSGDGVNKPRGFLSYPTVINSSWTADKVGFVKTGAAGAFLASGAAVNAYDRFIDAFHALRPAYRGNATWLMNDLTLAEARKVKDGQGNYIVSLNGGLLTLLERPVETDDNMPTLAANAFPVALADWKQAYVIVDRSAPRLLRDPFTNKPYIMFYTTKRVGGGVSNFQAIKLMQAAA